MTTTGRRRMATTDGSSAVRMRWPMQRLGSARQKVRDMLQILLMMPKIRATGHNAAAVPSLVGQGRGAFATPAEDRVCRNRYAEIPSRPRRYLPYVRRTEPHFSHWAHFQHISCVSAESATALDTTCQPTKQLYKHYGQETQGWKGRKRQGQQLRQ